MATYPDRVLALDADAALQSYRALLIDPEARLGGIEDGGAA